MTYVDSSTALSGSVRKVFHQPSHKLLSRQGDMHVDSSVMQNGLDALDIKQALADKKGVPVTSEEYAVEFDRKVDALEVKSKEEVNRALEQEQEEPERGLENLQDARIAKQSQMESKKTELLQKIEAEIAIEQERAKLLYIMENSRKNAIDSARAKYGEKADIRSIQQSYDMLANNLDPKINDVTDMISMSIDNALHGQSRVRMLMPNGSMRSMDADVAFAMSELSSNAVFKKSSGIADTNDEITQELQNDGAYSAAEVRAVCELQDLMSMNAQKQATFEYKDPKSGEVDVKSVRDKRFREIGLPTVAMDYDYVYHLDETMQHNGRQLPSAMSSYTMQQELCNCGKTYGYYLE